MQQRLQEKQPHQSNTMFSDYFTNIGGGRADLPYY